MIKKKKVCFSYAHAWSSSQSVHPVTVFFFPMATLYPSRTWDLNESTKAEVFHIIFLFLWASVRSSMSRKYDCSGHLFMSGFTMNQQVLWTYPLPNLWRSTLCHCLSRTMGKTNKRWTTIIENWNIKQQEKPLKMGLINVPFPLVYSFFTLCYKLMPWVTQVSKNWAPGVCQEAEMMNIRSRGSL